MNTALAKEARWRARAVLCSFSCHRLPLRGMVATPVGTAPCAAWGSAHSRLASVGSETSRRHHQHGRCPLPSTASAPRGAAQHSSLDACYGQWAALHALCPRRCHGSGVAARRGGRSPVLTSAVGAGNGQGSRGSSTPFERLSEGSMTVVTSAVAEASRLQSSEVCACGTETTPPHNTAGAPYIDSLNTRLAPTTCCLHSPSTAATREWRCKRREAVQTL